MGADCPAASAERVLALAASLAASILRRLDGSPTSYSGGDVFAGGRRKPSGPFAGGCRPSVLSPYSSSLRTARQSAAQRVNLVLKGIKYVLSEADPISENPEVGLGHIHYLKTFDVH